MKKSYYLLLVCAIAFSNHLFADSKWNLEKDSNGIKIYTREIPGSSLKEFKGIMYLHNTTLASLTALLEDIPSYTQWMQNCIEAKLLKKINTYERIIYTVTDAPWPVTDRDLVTYSKVSQHAKTLAITISISAKAHYVPPKPGKIRVPSLSGYWYFQPLSSGYTMVIYQLHSDPGGSLPAWLANSSVVDLPFNTLSKMKLQVKKYQHVHNPLFKELTK